MKLTSLFLFLALPAMSSDFETRMEALGQIESGKNDKAIGASGEVSRYQILPDVWMSAFPPKELKRNHPEWNGKIIGDPEDEYCARIVADIIMEERVSAFVKASGRQPNDFEWFMLWHRPARVSNPRSSESKVAQRFANLCESLSTKPINHQ